jgi:hypothetical protein
MTNKYKDVDDAFDKEFSIGKGRKWVHTIEEANEVKQFIHQALDAKEKEIINKCLSVAPKEEKESKHIASDDCLCYQCSPEGSVGYDSGWNGCIKVLKSNIQKLIDKK